MDRVEAIVATDLTKWFGEGESKTTAVKGVGLTAHFGEMLFIVGPSGSGKTTLLSMISGILRPNSGKVTVKGTDVWTLTKDQLAEFRLNTIGFVFQDYHLFPRLTTAENVAIPLILKQDDWGDSITEAKKQLAIVGLQTRCDTLPVKLSGGEQQRVAIARAIISKPEILIMDEPTASLDGDTGRMIIAFVKKNILNEHRCILIVTHDADHSGNITTSSSDSITLALATGSGTLSGTTTEAAVNGIATFSNLAISSAGSYTLSATDASSSSVTTANSSSFTIAAGKLVFHPAPKSGTAGDPLTPAVVVQLQDGGGNVVTSDNSTIVTLSLVGVNGANPITGTTTATLSSGVATFSNITLTKAGTYQLQATDNNNDVLATTKPFGVGGDKLMFLVPPKNSDVNSPLAVTVEALAPGGKIDKGATDSVALSLNIISGGVGAVLAGALSAPLVGGKATFPVSSGIAINTAGMYTLTASATTVDDSGNTITDYGTTAVPSKSFTVTGLRLKLLTPPPSTVDIAEPFALAVEIVDTHGNPPN